MKLKKGIEIKVIEVYIILAGLLFGSFFNVCIYRIERGKSIAFPSSYCTSCHNKIKRYDLIPVISWIILKGRCRHCKEKISIRYPIIELTAAFIFLLVYMKYGISIFSLKYIVLISLLIVIGIIDFDTTDVYDSTILTGLIFGTVFAITAYFLKSDVLSLVFGALLGGGTIAVIILLTNGMGLGDAEICLICGIFLGVKLTIVMLFLSFLIGGVTAVILLALKLKSTKDYIPFGPVIAVAGIITVFFGQNILNYYMSFLR